MVSYLVISFLAVALAIASGLVVTERRRRRGLQDLLGRLLEKAPQDAEA